MLHIWITCLVAAITFVVPVYAADETVTVDIQVLKQMQDTLQYQQLQLQQQAAQIQGQAAQIQHQTDLLKKLEQQLSALTKQPKEQPSKPSVAESSTVSEKILKMLPFVISGNDKIRLGLSGQINRAMNVISDGGGTSVYHVDNNVSNSRFKLLGSAVLNDDLAMGTRLEMTFTADESSKVSQQNQSPGNYINARWVDLNIASKTYGKISIGKGDTASYNSGSADLSKTDSIQYSSVADIAGGIYFRRKNGQLTKTAVADAFNNFDGLGAKSRLRYDSPTFKGFSLAGSVISDRRSDVALYWEGDGCGFQNSGAFALSDPHLADSRLQYDGSFSLLHSASGLNLSLAGGMLDNKLSDNSMNLYAKLGWLANLTGIGYTAFGIDYVRSENIAAAGDLGTSLGAAMVQEFKKAAAEIYLQYRVYVLKMGNGTAVNDIHAGTVGVLVKF